MESLNNIIEDHIDIQRGGDLQRRGLEVELDLDPDMPSAFPDSLSGEGTPKHLRNMLIELTGEQYDAKLVGDRTITKLRYSTLFVDGVQVVIIEHNGKPIPEPTINNLNMRLAEIHSEKEPVSPDRRGGNMRAATQISSYGGRIYIENHPEREYKVETTVELPLERAAS